MSPVVVNEFTTTVAEEPVGPQASAASPASSPWDELERVRRAAAELDDLRDRTRSEGLSD